MVARHFDCCARKFSIQLNVLYPHAKSIHIQQNWIAQSSKCSALLAPLFEMPRRAVRKKIRVETVPIAKTDWQVRSLCQRQPLVLRCKSILLIPWQLLRYVAAITVYTSCSPLASPATIGLRCNSTLGSPVAVVWL